MLICINLEERFGEVPILVLECRQRALVELIHQCVVACKLLLTQTQTFLVEVAEVLVGFRW